MARSQAGESKAPLVIALSFFVLLSLVLGGLTVATFGDVDKAREDAKKAAADKDAAQKKEREAAQKALLYKAALGVADEKDRADLANLTEKDAVKQAHADLVQKVQTQVGGAVAREVRERLVGEGGRLDLSAADVLDWPWADANLAGPAKPLIDQVVAFFAAQQLEKRQAARAREDADKEKAAARAAKAAADAEQERLKAELDALPERVEARVQAFDEQFKEAQAQYARETEKNNEERVRFAQEKGQLQIDLRRKDEEIERMKKLLRDKDALLETRTDPFAYDRPHGKVVRRRGQVVELDLGYADRVKPGLKFALHPADTPTRGFDARKREFRAPAGGTEQRVVPKAQVEVIRNLGPNRSEARIINGTESDPIREPVIDGDLAYNAVWRKGEADHVALVGIFDLNGDGTDDIRRLEADLTGMGIVVDAVYDLGKRQWDRKLTDKTTFVVKGRVPFQEVQPGEPPESLAQKSALVDDLNAAIAAVRQTTTASVVQLRDFFPRVGYPADLSVDPRRINQAATKYLTPGRPADGAPPAGAADGPGY